MTKHSFSLAIALHGLLAIQVQGQSLKTKQENGVIEIAFVSDTQAPMRIEKVWLKSHDNTRATQVIFNEITQRKPEALFILGDVVSLAKNEKKWKDMDKYLAALRGSDISVYALLGNHDVMGNPKRGQEQFHKRFPDMVNTGYYQIVDSIAVLLLNSNFNTLSAQDQQKQQDFYERTLKLMDEDPGVRFIIVTCHHSPYTNSTVVRPSTAVQRQFVPLFVRSKKAKLFITGHAHAFEYFRIQGKDFLTIGGGGGLHHPLKKNNEALPKESKDYNPEFHFVTVQRHGDTLTVTSYRLEDDFLNFQVGYRFEAGGTR